MANPNPGGNVYKREGGDAHEAWNAMISRVNDDRANPPEDTDCEPLDPIDSVDPDHVWTIQDVEDVRSAIDEMCPFTWTEELEYWHDDIISELEEALDREWGGWGDEEECCEPDEEECVADCSNGVPYGGNPVTTYIGSFTTSGCIVSPPASCTSEQQEAAEDKGTEANIAMSEWSDLWGEYCALVDECEKLQEELDRLEDQLEALEEARDDECAKPPPNNCAAAQEAVDAKQDEVDAKEEELQEAEAERDAKKTEADEKEAEADAAAAESMSLADAAAPYDCQYYYSSAPGSQPCVDTDCEQLPPECLGFPYPGKRCCVSWAVFRKAHVYWRWGTEWHGDWGIEMSGGYTRSGQPYTTYIRACAGISANACSGTTCENPCPSYQVYEVELRQTFPYTTLEGEICCEDP